MREQKVRMEERLEKVASWLAERRVKKGIQFLNEHAPIGWYRNLFNNYDGRSRFRGRTNYDNECPSALAFESRGDLANKFGYVTSASVANHFEISLHEGVRMGFLPRGIITAKLLDTTWQRLLGELPTGVHRHETELDRQFRGRMRIGISARLLAGISLRRSLPAK